MGRSTTWRHRALAASALAAGVLVVAAAPPARAQAAKDEAKPKAKAKAAPTRPPVPPTYQNVAYGEHPRQVLDFYQADTKGPAPLVVFIHGGGWVNGDKHGVSAALVKSLRDQGISVAAINYRFTTQADEAGIEPPVKWPLEDAARAIQYLRWKADEWDID